MARCLLILLVALGLGAPAQAGVPFIYGQVQAAMDRAKAEGRPLMVDVFATWCGPCKELDAKVFQSPGAEEALSAFVALKVDAEAGEGPAFVERHHVVGYPTVLFLDSQGNEIDRIFGEVPAQQFFDSARDFLAGRNTLAELEKRFASERAGDLELSFEILLRHAARVDEAPALAHLELLEGARAGLAKAPAPADPDARALRAGTLARLDELAAHGRYVIAKYVLLRGKKQYSRARQSLLELRRRFPGSPYATSALYDLAQACQGLKDAAGTRKALDEFLAANGNSADAAGTYAWFSFKHGFDTARGIQIAVQALEKAPDDDGLWDTLSELYFARGEKQKALEANSKALALKPQDAYYREQQQKFER